MTQNPIVVLHVSNSGEDLQRAMLSSQAIRQAQPETDVQIIVSGEAINAVSQNADPITELINKTQADVRVCRVGLGRRNIAESEVQEGISITPNASVALVEAQQNGASYIRV